MVYAYVITWVQIITRETLHLRQQRREFLIVCIKFTSLPISVALLIIKLFMLWFDAGDTPVAHGGTADREEHHGGFPVPTESQPTVKSGSQHQAPTHLHKASSSRKHGPIVSHLKELLVAVNPSDILLDLLANDIVTEEEYREVDSVQLNGDRKMAAKRLFAFLLHKNDEKVRSFAECLEDSGDCSLQRIGKAMRDELQEDSHTGMDKSATNCQFVRKRKRRNTEIGITKQIDKNCEAET